MAVQLPDDMIVEILCRLPVKVVIRLKVVSKTWHRLISNVCARYSRPPRRPILQAFCSYVLFKKLVGWDTLLRTLAIPMFMIAWARPMDCGFVCLYVALHAFF